MIKCVSYLRVSDKSQISGTGFSRQKQNIQKYAEKNGYEVVDWYQEEGISGTTDLEDRPAFTRMIQRIFKNGVKTILIESMDRLARQYTVSETLAVYIASKGINLISSNTGENITQALEGDPMKKALIQIQGVFAELDKSQLVKKLSIGKEIRRKENRKAGILTLEGRGKCEGRKSYKETSPELIKQAKRLYRINPLTKKRRSLPKISKELFKLGYMTSKENPFSPSQVKSLVTR